MAFSCATAPITDFTIPQESDRIKEGTIFKLPVNSTWPLQPLQWKKRTLVLTKYGLSYMMPPKEACGITAEKAGAAGAESSDGFYARGSATAAVGEAGTRDETRIQQLMSQIEDMNDQADDIRTFTEKGKAMHDAKKAALEARLATLLDEAEQHGVGSFELKDLTTKTGNSSGGGASTSGERSDHSSDSGTETDEEARPYHIVDARPKLNALANQAAGKGFEHPSHYGAGCTVTFLEIDNIHTMRGSIESLISACQTIAENEGGGGATGGAAGAARRGRRGRARGSSSSTSARWSRPSSSSSAPTTEDTASAPSSAASSSPASASTSPLPLPSPSPGAQAAIEEADEEEEEKEAIGKERQQQQEEEEEEQEQQSQPQPQPQPQQSQPQPQCKEGQAVDDEQEAASTSSASAASSESPTSSSPSSSSELPESSSLLLPAVPAEGDRAGAGAGAGAAVDRVPALLSAHFIAPSSSTESDGGDAEGKGIVYGSRSSSSEVSTASDSASTAGGVDLAAPLDDEGGSNVVELDAFAAALRDGIERSHWLLHVRKVLVGAVKVAKLVGMKHESVLVHCSDGWDRTAQLTALAQLLLDPHYRTIAGFNELIQKEWLSFGHKFSDRCCMVGQAGSSEASPIFTQFLDCVWQLIQHAPLGAFEFTAAYLLAIHNAVASRRHGTFLCNTERERLREHDLPSRTACLWAELKADLLVQQLAAASTEEHCAAVLGAGAVGTAGAADVDVVAVGYSNASYSDGVEGLLAVEFKKQSDVKFFEELYQPKMLPTRLKAMPY